MTLSLSKARYCHLDRRDLDSVGNGRRCNGVLPLATSSKPARPVHCWPAFRRARSAGLHLIELRAIRDRSPVAAGAAAPCAAACRRWPGALSRRGLCSGGRRSAVPDRPVCACPSCCTWCPCWPDRLYRAPWLAAAGHQLEAGAADAVVAGDLPCQVERPAPGLAAGRGRSPAAARAAALGARAGPAGGAAARRR